MKITDIKNNEKSISCVAEAEKAEWHQIIDKEKEKAAKNIKIPGFRKGKVPKEVALKAVDLTKVIGDAVNAFIYKAVEEIEKNEEIKKINDDVYPTPSVEFDKKINEDEAAVTIVYWKMPKITIDNYKDLGLNFEPVKVTDEMVDSEIDNLLSREKMLTKKQEGKLQKGEQATFDFTGFVDGKEFPGGAAKNYDLEIGSGNFIPGFEDQMIGMSIGEEKDLNLKFPEDYHAKDLAGKDVVFKVKLNEINEIKKPELNEEFIKGLNLPNKEIKTPDQLRNFIKEDIEKYLKQRSYDEQIRKINDAIYEKASSKEIPQVIIDDETREIRKQFDAKVSQMGIKVDDFLKMTQKSEEDLKKELSEQAAKNCVVYSVLDYVIEQEKLSVDEKTVEERIEMLAKAYSRPVEEIKKIISVDTLKESLLHEEALLKIIDWNTKK